LIEINLGVPASGDEYVPILSWVLAKQAPKAQLAIAEALAHLGAPTVAGSYKPPFPQNYGPENAWELPKMEKPDQEPAVSWILNVLGKSQRKLVALLVAAGPDGVWSGDLRHMAGYDEATGMSGVYRAIAGRFRRTGHRPVWNGGEKDSQNGQLLSVPDGDAREMFMTAIANEFPDLAAEVGIG
jgi:hypothetical protein